MKARVYLRIGKSKKGFRVAASTKPNSKPLEDGSYNTTFYPTVGFAVDFNIPEELFKKAETVIAEINITGKNSKINAEVESIEPLK